MHANIWVLRCDWTQWPLFVVTLLSVNSLSCEVNWHLNGQLDWFCASYQTFVEEHVVHQRRHFLDWVYFLRGGARQWNQRKVGRVECSCCCSDFSSGVGDDAIDVDDILPSTRLWGWYAYVDSNQSWKWENKHAACRCVRGYKQQAPICLTSSRHRWATRVAGQRVQALYEQ